MVYTIVRFFDVTPLGQILNRFSADTNIIDQVSERQTERDLFDSSVKYVSFILSPLRYEQPLVSTQTCDLSSAVVNIIVSMRLRMWRMRVNGRRLRSLSTAHSPNTRVSHSLHSTLSLSDWGHCFRHPCLPNCTDATCCGFLLYSEVLPGCFQVSNSLKDECTLWPNVMDFTRWKYVISNQGH